MNQKRKLNLKNSIATAGLLLAATLTVQTNALATPACENLGGGVIFKDGLYGLGAGFLITGLSLIAVQYPHDYAPPLASGSLIGLSAGLGVGVFEWMSRDCKRGFSMRPKINVPGSRFPNESFKWANVSLGTGLEFTYRY